MSWPDLVWVGLAGSVGAVSRFVLDGMIRRGRASRVPFGTMTINLTGSLLFGILTGVVLFHAVPARVALVAGSGFCGGYTTFSTASFETVRLIQEGECGAGLVSVLGNSLGALLAAALGLALASV